MNKRGKNKNDKKLIFLGKNIIAHISQKCYNKLKEKTKNIFHLEKKCDIMRAYRRLWEDRK